MDTDLPGVAPSGDVLLIVPPFASIDRPSYGLHLLKALAERERFSATVLYANIHFAKRIGEGFYTELCHSPVGKLNGERVFARAAFEAQDGAGTPYSRPIATSDLRRLAREHDIDDIEAIAAEWIDALARAVAHLDYPIVGCNAMFEQTTATMALFRRLKTLRPDMTLIVGGALCEGPMARGMLSLNVAVDHVFSGESETTFIDFLTRRRRGERPAQRIFEGEPCLDLEALPNVDYGDYFTQLRAIYPDSGFIKANTIWLPYEGSRGCWWGQKHHCTFCGLNGNGMVYRQRSAGRVHRDLAEYAQRYSARRVMMLDNIMPHRYFHDLLPLLKEQKLELDIFFEQKANLTFRRMRALREAGVNVIQPGIESLSDHMLQLMKKGVQARQNIALLRFARSIEIEVNWNLLYGFPGDEEADYRQIYDLIPLLTHLNPPSGFSGLSIDRFSPYHSTPESYGISAVRPMPAYFDVYPAHAALADLAYHFVGDYETASRRDTEFVDSITEAVEAWRAIWFDAKSVVPTLAVSPLADNAFIIADTRAVATKPYHLVDRPRAMAALIETAPGDLAGAWAIENRLAVRIGDVVVPLAVADGELFGEIFDPRADARQSELVA